MVEILRERNIPFPLFSKAAPRNFISVIINSNWS